MLFFTFIKEISSFLIKFLHPNYYLTTIRYENIKQYSLMKEKGLNSYFLFDKQYEWEKLRKSLDTIGYIPSIIVSKYIEPKERITEYSIVNGLHRTFILSENKKPNDSIKVWVSKSASINVKKYINIDFEVKKILNENINKSNEEYLKRIKNSPNYKILKNKILKNKI